MNDTISIEGTEFKMGEFDDIFETTHITSKMNYETKTESQIIYNHPTKDFTVRKITFQNRTTVFTKESIKTLEEALIIGGLK